LRTLLALCASSHELTDTSQVHVTLGLLEDLSSEGTVGASAALRNQSRQVD